MDFFLTQVSGTLDFSFSPALSPTGTLTFKTAVNSNGSATFNVVASDGTRDFVSVTLIITANGPPVPPVPPVLAIASLTLPGAGGGNADGTFSGSLTGATPGFIAELQASSDLSSWTTIATQTVDTNGNATFTNSVDTGSGTDPVARKRRFYRVCAKER